MVTARFIFCGGGTGGHLFPGIAVALAIRKKAPESAILFVGTRRGLEERVLPTYGFNFRPVKSAGFKNLGLAKKLKALFILPVGIFEGLGLMRSFRPSVVVGLGSYSALPVMIAGILKRIRRVIQEQNSIPGLTNRLLAPFAHKIFVSFETTITHFPQHKTLLTGNPIREGLCQGKEKEIQKDSFHLLVLGGSLGAHFINTLCMTDLPGILERYPHLQVTLQTGNQDLEEARKVFEPFGKRVRVIPFIDDMTTTYRWADFVVARAGATTLAELSACGIPAFLIPFPYAANDHQMENARYYASRGGAIVHPQTEVTESIFTGILEKYLTHPKELQAMSEKMKALGHPEAAETIAAALLSLASSRGGTT
jgi:UDP-N-acetylglucosamine--N-acetylmuramyl-(pentapeptide) pyrophosphoryl-undecaprenol N-acetylglucosamine transferase